MTLSGTIEDCAPIGDGTTLPPDPYSIAIPLVYYPTFGAGGVPLWISDCLNSAPFSHFCPPAPPIRLVFGCNIGTAQFEHLWYCGCTGVADIPCPPSPSTLAACSGSTYTTTSWTCTPFSLTFPIASGTSLYNTFQGCCILPFCFYPYYIFTSATITP